MIKWISMIGIILMLSCQEESSVKREKNILDSLGFEDYREIIRHPISLQDTIMGGDWSKIEFETTVYEFDTVQSGELVVKSFEFMNSGSKPLYILDTKVSCGCTVASYTEKPVNPGETGSIDIEFDTEGKSGEQNKSVIVLSNSYPNENRLYLKGYVKTK